jgi:hypothetical protein
MLDLKKLKIEELFHRASSRGQQYLNLANHPQHIYEIFSQKNLSTLKNLKLNSLYMRVEGFFLYKPLIDAINELKLLGLRELIIITDLNESIVALNDFIKENNIDINFRVVKLNHEKLDLISQDPLVANDIMAIERIDKKAMYYKNGGSLDFLNDETSYALILQNARKKGEAIYTQNSFHLEEIQYISESKNTSSKRTKNPKDLTDLVTVNSEVQLNTNIDAQVTTETNQQAETEEEEEQAIDSEQIDSKLNKAQAIKYLENQKLWLFYPHTLHPCASTSMPQTIDRIFSSFDNIEYISKKALDELISPYCHYFTEGINQANLPIGLGFQKKMLYLTPYRNKKFPIDNFTVKIEMEYPQSADILNYSWLDFAARSTIELNDLFGSSEAPDHAALFEHPYQECKDAEVGCFLDVATNQQHARYTLSVLGPRYISSNLPSVNDSDKSLTKDILFCNIPYKLYDHTKANIDRIKEIEIELKSRSLTFIFRLIFPYAAELNIILNDKFSAFFVKLFVDIFPLPLNKEKHAFFSKIFNEIYGGNHVDLFVKISEHFDALELFYTKVNDLLNRQELRALDYDTAIAKIINIVTKQLKNSDNFKIVLARLLDMFEYSFSMGGNLYEACEYISNSEEGLLINDRKVLQNAKKHQAIVMHEYSFFNYLDTAQVSIKDNYNKITLINGDYVESIADSWKAEHDITRNSFLYLSTIASHQRVSLDAYGQYSRLIENSQIAKEFWLREAFEGSALMSKGERDQKINKRLEEPQDDLSQLKQWLESQSKQYQILTWKEGHWFNFDKQSILKNYSITQLNYIAQFFRINILSSTGFNYDIKLPTQEFENFISLIDLFFCQEKIYFPIIVQRNFFDTGISNLGNTIYMNSDFKSDTYNLDLIKDRNTKLLEKVTIFNDLYKKAPELNFYQLVSLALVKINFDKDYTSIIKTLMPYGRFSGYMLKALLSTPISHSVGLDELNLRIAAIEKMLIFIEHHHEVITNKGMHPENLVFFAACSTNKALDEQDIGLFLDTMENINPALKEKLLKMFIVSALPFDNGIITNGDTYNLLREIAKEVILPLQTEPITFIKDYKALIASIAKLRENLDKSKVIALVGQDFDAKLFSIQKELMFLLINRDSPYIKSCPQKEARITEELNGWMQELSSKLLSIWQERLEINGLDTTGIIARYQQHDSGTLFKIAAEILETYTGIIVRYQQHDSEALFKIAAEILETYEESPIPVVTYPTLTLEQLGDHDFLEHIIETSKQWVHDYSHETRFNALSLASMKNINLDLTPIFRKYELPHMEVHSSF